MPPFWVPRWQLGAAAGALGVTAHQWQADDSPVGAVSCEAAPPPREIPLHAPRATAVSLAELHRWLEQRGADLAGIEIRRSAAADGGRFGAFATAEGQRRASRGWGWVLPGSWVGRDGGTATLATFPISSALTAASAAADPRQGALLAELLQLGVIDERTAVMVYLVVERLRGRESPLGPWVSTLPATFTTPLFWRDGDLEWLRGTTLHKATELRRRSLQEAWRRVEPACRQLALSTGADLEPAFEDFLWAFSIFWSRALALPVPTATGGALTGVTMTEGIVPGLDFCNHARASPCRWTVFGGNGSSRKASAPTDVRLTCPRSSKLRQGQEVTIDYGDKSNEELLFLYGFVDEGNPHDALMLACPLPPPAEWDPTLQARVALLQRRGLTPQIFLPASHLEPRPPTARKGACKEGDLPPGVSEVLEVFVMEAADLRRELEASLEAEETTCSGPSGDGSAGSAAGKARGCTPRAGSSPGMGEMERSGLRMAVLTTVVRLLELKTSELESAAAGTGSLEADERLLESIKGGDGTSAMLTPAQRAALQYRVGQKRLARRYLAHCNALLAQELRHLHALAAAS